MTTFVDTNVLVDALDPNSENHQWATQSLAGADQPLVICDIVYSEFSVSIDSVGDTNAAIQSLSLERYPFTEASLFGAGKAYLQYKKKNAGPKLNVLSDFLIGALADDEGAPLLTANVRDYKTYFPKLTLISPPGG
jgi:predicted nucleic acid-binding protein